MATELILIRHGETDWNYHKRYCGFTDIGLNANGRRQARKLSKKLNKLCKGLGVLQDKEEIYKIYSSDLIRTRQFAKIVLKNIPIEELPELREVNFGKFEGLTYEEIMRKYPKIYRKWLDNPCGITIPSGESLNHLARRVRKALAKILSCNNNRTVAVFTHAGPIGVILCDILNLGLKEIWRMKQDSANLNIIEFNNEKEGRILLRNNTS